MSDLPTLPAGFYLAKHPDYRRPTIVEFNAGPKCEPHWRTQDDNRLRGDPRAAGWTLTPVERCEALERLHGAAELYMDPRKEPSQTEYDALVAALADLRRPK